MADTIQLTLPLLSPSQAQKHVTVNEALMRLDGLVQVAIASRTIADPPLAADGTLYAVPAGAVNAWAGQDGNLAVRSNGGWLFAVPRAGWRAFLIDEGAPAVHDGSDWQAGIVSLMPSGAGMSFRSIEIDHVVTAGASSTTAAIIPSNAVVFGATARVLTDLTGTLTGWELGNPGASNRYGSGLGLTAGAWVRGVLGQPTAFYSPTQMLLTALGGSFAGGSVRIAVHVAELSLPG